MNKRQKKKFVAPKVTVQEAWDVLANHLVRLKGGDNCGHCFFIDSSTDDEGKLTITDTTKTVLTSTLTSQQIAAELYQKGEI